MTKEELRELRHFINFDMRSMSACVGVPLSTYQRYEDGTAAVPERIERAVLELEQINRQFMSRYDPGGEFDQIISREYPHGFMSEVVGC